MYRRIFPTPFVKTGTLVAGTVSLLWFLASLFLCLLECRPVRKAWDIYNTVDGTCMPMNQLSLAKIVMQAPNILLNLATLSLPLYEVYNLHIERAQKIALGSVFGLGAVSIVCSVVQMKYMVDLYRQDVEVTSECCPEPHPTLPALQLWGL
jgi:hypothetical protein